MSLASSKAALRTWLAAVVLTFLLLWVVAFAATPVTPWLQVEGEALVLGLSSIGWSDVLVGSITAGLFAGAALVVAGAERAIWIPALAALLLAPPIADKVAGTSYVVPHLAGHWNDLVFGRWNPELPVLLAASWAGAVLEVGIIALPAALVAIRHRPRPVDLAVSSVVVVVAGALDVVFLDGSTVAPFSMVAGLAGIGPLAWSLAGVLVLWALSVAGPWGLLATSGGLRALLAEDD